MALWSMMLAYAQLGQVVRVFCEVLILSGASYRTRFVFSVWLVDLSGSTQILVSAPVVEGEKIYIIFPCTLPFFFASLFSNSSSLRGKLVLKRVVLALCSSSRPEGLESLCFRQE